MSFALTPVSLATAVVGTKGVIDLTAVGVGAGGISSNPAFSQHTATIFFFNDSGCGLGLTFSQGGQGFNLPAGAWSPIGIPLGESRINYAVQYVLPNAPVSLLLMTYYAPNEAIPQSMTLGNSPVGIGGTITTALNALSNEGNSANTLVIDIGDVLLSQLWQVFTDHFLLAVDQAGVRHYVLRGSTSGNAAQIGQTGDTSEVLGNLLVDGATTLTGAVTATSTSNTLSASLLLQGINVQFGQLGKSTTADMVDGGTNGTIYYKGPIDASNNNTVIVQSQGTGKVILQNAVGPVNVLTADGNNGIYLASGKIGRTTSADLLDASGTGVFLKGTTAGGGFAFQAPNGTTVWSLKKVTHGTVVAVSNGTVTVTHNLGQTPDAVFITPNNGAAGSQTFAVWNVGATTFQIFNAANTPTYYWEAKLY